MLSGARYFLSDVAHWIRGHPLRAAIGALIVVGLIVAAVIGIESLVEDDGGSTLAPAPEVVVRAEEPPEEPTDLGFPAFATSNTTRVAGADSIAVAAGIALATFPSAGGADGPNAVTIVPADDWGAGIAAAPLVSDPVGAPILLSDGDEIPELTALALEALDPRGSRETDGRQAFTVGEAPEPEGAKTARIEGANAAEVGAEVTVMRERLTGEEPAHLLIASSDDPGFAMPAASWAARSGDPVLFAQRDSVPAATLEVIERYKNAPVYLLGPESVISERAEKEIAGATKASVRRAGDEDDPVANARWRSPGTSMGRSGGTSTTPAMGS